VDCHRKFGTGLAEGCDTLATKGTLSGGGNVISVVPRGLKSLRGHTKKLAEKVFAAGGTVLSEYPDDLSKIFSRHYLRRDAIITGLSQKTVIIAAEERSGSAATANHALRQGRAVIIIGLNVLDNHNAGNLQNNRWVFAS